MFLAPQEEVDEGIDIHLFPGGRLGYVVASGNAQGKRSRVAGLCVHPFLCLCIPARGDRAGQHIELVHVAVELFGCLEAQFDESQGVLFVRHDCGLVAATLKQRPGEHVPRCGSRALGIGVSRHPLHPHLVLALVHVPLNALSERIDCATAVHNGVRGDGAIDADCAAPAVPAAWVPEGHCALEILAVAQKFGMVVRPGFPVIRLPFHGATHQNPCARGVAPEVGNGRACIHAEGACTIDADEVLACGDVELIGGIERP